MNFQQKIISISISFLIFIVIIELIRKKKIMEELTWIWLFAGLMIVVVSVWENLLEIISRLTGIVTPTSIVFFFGIIFLILINLQISIKLSKNAEQIKNLVQELALEKYDKEILNRKLNTND